MTRVLSEFTESFRIAFTQLRAHQLRSLLTALGVIIGIVAVTLMGTAIRGIDLGFQSSLAMLGDDVIYVDKWPWTNVPDWWNYANRPQIRPESGARNPPATRNRLVFPEPLAPSRTKISPLAMSRSSPSSAKVAP